MNRPTSSFFRTANWILAVAFTVAPVLSEAQTSITCRSLIREYLDWDKSRDQVCDNRVSSRDRFATYRLVQNRHRHGDKNRVYDFGYAGYMEGSLLANQTSRTLSGWNHMVFSDRSNHFPPQRFDRLRYDRVTLELSSTGTGKLILNRWGNTTQKMAAMRCHRDDVGGYISGFFREGDGTAAFSLTMHKAEQSLACLR